jgi:hypothetical protein
MRQKLQHQFNLDSSTIHLKEVDQAGNRSVTNIEISH